MAFAARHYNLIDSSTIYQNYTVTGMYAGATFAYENGTEESSKQIFALRGSIKLRIQFPAGDVREPLLIDCDTTTTPPGVYSAVIKDIADSPTCTITPVYFPPPFNKDIYSNGTPAVNVKILPIATAGQPIIQINPSSPQIVFHASEGVAAREHHVRYPATGTHKDTNIDVNNPSKAFGFLRLFKSSAVSSGNHYNHPDDIGFPIDKTDEVSWKLEDRTYHEIDTDATASAYIVRLLYDGEMYIFSREYFNIG